MDLDAFRWLLTDDGQAVLARAVEATADPGVDELAVQAELRRTTPADPRRRGAHPGRAAPPGGGEVRRPGAPDVLHPRRPRAGHPPLAWPPTGPAACRRRSRRASSTSGAASAATSSRSRGPGSPRPGSTSTRCGWRWPQANLGALGLSGAVQVADATQVDPTPFDVAFADPARRSGRGRTFHVEDWTPPWSFVEGLLRRDACVKVAPGIPHALIPHGVEAEWVSDRGEVKEAALWSGPARDRRPARDGDRRRRPGHPDRRGRPGPGRRRGRRPRRLPLRARRSGDPGRAGHRGGGRRQRPAARPARSPT